MNVFKDFSPDNSMKVSFHEVKNEIDIFIILCSNEVLQSDNIGVSVELSKENDLSKSSLSIGCILKSIENLLDGYNIFSMFVDGLPNDSIGSLSQLLEDLKFVQNMWLNFFRHSSLQVVKYNITYFTLNSL